MSSHFFDSAVAVALYVGVVLLFIGSAEFVVYRLRRKRWSRARGIALAAIAAIAAGIAWIVLTPVLVRLSAGNVPRILGVDLVGASVFTGPGLVLGAVAGLLVPRDGCTLRRGLATAVIVSWFGPGLCSLMWRFPFLMPMYGEDLVSTEVSRYCDAVGAGVREGTSAVELRRRLDAWGFALRPLTEYYRVWISERPQDADGGGEADELHQDRPMRDWRAASVAGRSVWLRCDRYDFDALRESGETRTRRQTILYRFDIDAQGAVACIDRQTCEVTVCTTDCGYQ